MQSELLTAFAPMLWVAGVHPHMLQLISCATSYNVFYSITSSSRLANLFNLHPCCTVVNFSEALFRAPHPCCYITSRQTSTELESRLQENIFQDTCQLLGLRCIGNVHNVMCDLFVTGGLLHAFELAAI